MENVWETYGKDMDMQVRSTQEAVYVACEMERGAVQLYERALAVADGLGLTDETLIACLTAMRDDEKRHLREFSLLYEGLDTERERALALSATAASVLFKGGLMGAVREGLLSDAQGLLRFAADAERTAAATYRSFADQCEGADTAAMLRVIASEEDKHLDTLEAYRRAMG